MAALNADETGQQQRGKANDQQGPGIDQVNHRCAYITVSAPRPT